MRVVLGYGGDSLPHVSLTVQDKLLLDDVSEPWQVDAPAHVHAELAVLGDALKLLLLGGVEA